MVLLDMIRKSYKNLLWDLIFTSPKHDVVASCIIFAMDLFQILSEVVILLIK